MSPAASSAAAYSAIEMAPLTCGLASNTRRRHGFGTRIEPDPEESQPQ